jgi:anion-transporting  ArsA/GET3 family ATPase
MAMEKLFELHAEARFDLIVVDTPPTRNALDFVDAPRRLTRFLDNRIFRLLMLPTRMGIKVLNAAAQTFLRTISKVVGGAVVTDAIAFFQAFEGMEDGFRDRAQRVLDLLADPGTAFVLVSSPRRDAVAESEFFVDKLAEAGIPVQGLVVNRMQPRFTSNGAGGGAPLAAGTGADGQRTAALAGTPLGALWENLTDLSRLADAEDAEVASLVGRVAPGPTARVPLLESDVHDLDGVAEVSRYVFADAEPASRPSS